MKFPAANNYSSEKEKSHRSPVPKFSSVALLSPPFPSHCLLLLLSTKSKSFNTCWPESSSFWGCLHISRWGEQPGNSPGAATWELRCLGGVFSRGDLATTAPQAIRCKTGLSQVWCGHLHFFFSWRISQIGFQRGNYCLPARNGVFRLKFAS